MKASVTQHLLYSVKGFIVGSSMLIPGVSGGSMAMVLGVYDKLVDSVGSFLKHKRQSLLLILLFSLGALAGMLLISKPLLFLKETYTRPVMYFFIGAVAGSVPMMLRLSKSRRKSPIASILYLLLGAAIVILISLIPQNIFSPDTGSGFIGYALLFAAGLLIAVAFVLPGISASYMLLVTGLYDETMRAVTELYIPFLLPLLLGLGIGVIITTKLIDTLLKRYPRAAYLTILGFMVGSIVIIFPGIPVGIEFLFCPLLFVAGFIGIKLLTDLTPDT